MHTGNDVPTNELDRLRTYREASELLGLPYFKVQRAALKGLIPTYSLLNSRKYVTLRDIIARLSPTT
jgi:hypothetical protein